MRVINESKGLCSNLFGPSKTLYLLIAGATSGAFLVFHLYDFRGSLSEFKEAQLHFRRRALSDSSQFAAPRGTVANDLYDHRTPADDYESNRPLSNKNDYFNPRLQSELSEYEDHEQLSNFDEYIDPRATAEETVRSRRSRNDEYDTDQPGLRYRTSKDRHSHRSAPTEYEPRRPLSKVERYLGPRVTAKETVRYRRSRNDEYDTDQPDLRYSADKDVYSHRSTPSEYETREPPPNFDEYIDPRVTAEETVRSRRSRDDEYDSNQPGLRYSADKDVYAHRSTPSEYETREPPPDFDEYLDPRVTAEETVRSRRSIDDEYDSNQSGLRYSADKDVYAHRSTPTQYEPRHPRSNFDEKIEARVTTAESGNSLRSANKKYNSEQSNEYSEKETTPEEKAYSLQSTNDEFETDEKHEEYYASYSQQQDGVLPLFSGYKDVWEPVEYGRDIPVFWHIPKTGGTSVKAIMTSCHRLITVSEGGIQEGHDQDKEISVVQMSGGGKFVNVDTTNRPGILRAKEMGLVSSNVEIEALVTPFIYDANELFDPSEPRGRLFSFFRHPIDRAVSLFSYLQYADWEPSYNPAYKDMTIEEFAEMELGGENNWMTREFSNQREGELTEEHLEIAIDVVRRKFLVGLLSKRYESVERFEKYFGWKYKVMPTNQEACRADWLVKGGNKNTNKLAVPQPGSPAYEALSKQYHFDILLYDYIDETLFWEQESFFEGKEDGYRLDGTSCCKCGKEPTC